MSDDNRITHLEELVSYQTKTIEELSDQLAAQWTVIEKLRAKLEVLAERFLTMEEGARDEIPVTRPPHY